YVVNPINNDHCPPFQFHPTHSTEDYLSQAVSTASSIYFPLPIASTTPDESPSCAAKFF
ncbi:hypothetical protein BOTBODRAFT_69033, partial [Botryobasidium botryosum FD-172 SS1]